LRLSRHGTLIIADNVIREGEVMKQGTNDASVKGVRRFLEALSADPRAIGVAVQTVGSKGYDGFAIAVVIEGP